MSAISGALAQMVILLAVTAVGFWAGKLGYLDRTTIAHVIKLLVNFCVPAMILASNGGLDTAAGRAQVPVAFALAIAMFLVVVSAGYATAALLGSPRPERALYAFISMCTNTSFIGMPVISALFGPQSVILASVFILVQSTVTYSLGFCILTSAAGHRGPNPLTRLINAPIISCVVAIVLLYMPVSFPAVVEDALTLIGSPTAALAMMCVGAMMAEISVRELVTERRLYAFTLIRFALLPALLIAAAYPLVDSPLVLTVFAVTTVLPAGSMTAPFVAEYGGDARLAAKATIVTILFGFLTIPTAVAALAYLAPIS